MQSVSAPDRGLYPYRHMCGGWIGRYCGWGKGAGRERWQIRTGERNWRVESVLGQCSKSKRYRLTSADRR